MQRFRQSEAPDIALLGKPRFSGDEMASDLVEANARLSGQRMIVKLEK